MRYLPILLLLLAPALALAESQTVQTDGGRLDVRFTYPDVIAVGEHFQLIIEFVNPATQRVQEHIDYTLAVSNQTHDIFGPTPLTHTTEGALRGFEPAFGRAGVYTVSVGVEGILFQPIEPESASATIRVGNGAEEPAPEPAGEPAGGGCLIATAVYGSETAPQVQRLREIRDGAVMSTDAGRSFMAAFNPVYYSFSPAVADMERQNPLFRDLVGAAIRPMLWSLHAMEHADTEEKVVALGAAVILLNAAMYAGPVAGLVWLQRRVRLRSVR